MGEKTRQHTDMSSLVTMAHELKSPLAVIRQLALSKELYTDQAAVTQAFYRIELLSERMLRLVTTLSKSHDLSLVETETINLNRVCEEVLHEFYPICKELEKTIELRVSRQPLLVCSNHEILQSALVGLCDNALHYSSDSTPIIMHAQRIKSMMRVGVSDDGPGITKAQLHHHTNKPQMLSRRPQSSGLGLYIAEQFARALEGKFGIIKRRSGGLNVYLDLPQSKQLLLFGS